MLKGLQNFWNKLASIVLIALIFFGIYMAIFYLFFWVNDKDAVLITPADNTMSIEVCDTIYYKSDPDNELSDMQSTTVCIIGPLLNDQIEELPPSIKEQLPST